MAKKVAKRQALKRARGGVETIIDIVTPPEGEKGNLPHVSITIIGENGTREIFQPLPLLRRGPGEKPR